jgi:hypothetical protein
MNGGSTRKFEFQIRLTRDFARALAVNPADGRLLHFAATLRAHDARMQSIFSEVEAVAMREDFARSANVTQLELHERAKLVLANPEYREKLARGYSLVVGGKRALLDGPDADALEADLNSDVFKPLLENVRRYSLPKPGYEVSVAPFKIFPGKIPTSVKLTVAPSFLPAFVEGEAMTPQKMYFRRVLDAFSATLREAHDGEVVLDTPALVAAQRLEMQFKRDPALKDMVLGAALEIERPRPRWTPGQAPKF